MGVHRRVHQGQTARKLREISISAGENNYSASLRYTRRTHNGATPFPAQPRVHRPAENRSEIDKVAHAHSTASIYPVCGCYDEASPSLRSRSYATTE